MLHPSRARKPWLASLAATLVLALIMGAAKLFFAAPLPPEMLFNITGHLLGVPWVFNLIHSLPWSLGDFAKYALFGVTTLGFFALWFWLGLAYPRLARRFSRFTADLIYAALMALMVALLLFPLQGLGLFGLSAANFLYPPFPAHLWAFGFGLVFALALHLFTSAERPYSAARRESLHTLTFGMVVLGFGAALGNALFSALAYAQSAIEALVQQVRGLSPEVTPTEAHYVVSKNVFNPSVPEAGWSLTLRGMVENEVTLTLDDLEQLPSVERTSTLTCISNPVGGDLIGNSVWTGVMLGDLLELAGVQSGATELILRAADNYSDSFPLEAALREGTIVAYLQNGEPLTRDHGFPARVLVPGIYGMKNVKWVTEIELTDQEYLGYWQNRGWSEQAVVKTMSRIDTAEATRLEDGAWAIGGISYAGLRGIQRVEVSMDNGETWQEARLDPAINDLSWNLWVYTWNPEPGAYEVWVRATDGTGEIQTATRTQPLPDGATGYHMLRVRVS